MDPLAIIVALLVAIAVPIIYKFRAKRSSREPRKSTRNNQKAIDRKATTNQQENQEVITICEGKVHVATGFGLANAIVIEGADGCILIDTMESLEAAQEAFNALKEVIKEKPIKAVILTHFHADHT